MARLARFKIKNSEAWYHVHSRTSGLKGEYPLSNPLCQEKMIDLLKHFSNGYSCEIASFCVMGNHYHVVLKFDAYREMNSEELLEKALALYPGSEKFLTSWSEDKWKHFNARIFDLSEYMRNVQSAFARWYNHRFDRRGRFWADRFKSVYLQDPRAVLDCVLYVELNPVRAGLVQRPEMWQGASLSLRQTYKGEWLIPLQTILNKNSESKEAMKEFRYLLYYRGSVPTKKDQVSISQEIIEEEKQRGFQTGGIYRKRLRYFADGIVLGSEDYIRQQLKEMQEKGQYIRRKNPIIQLDGIHLTLREQRSHAVDF